MTTWCSRRATALTAASVLSLSLIGVVAHPPDAGAANAVATGPAVVLPGRSAIPHLSARLATLAKSPSLSTKAQAQVTGTAPSGPGSLQREPGTDDLLVDIRVARWSAATLAGLESAGVGIVHRAAALRTVTATVTPSDLLALARTPGVQYVSEIERPQFNAGPVCDSVVSEGDQILNALQERTNGHIDGTGVTVGILSDSFDTNTSAVTRAADDVVSDNLPGTSNTCGHATPVGVQQDYSGGGQADEGRAMAQIVHDLAPGARILFATADNGIDAFADDIRALANAGADVIVDDVTYFAEPFYQDGPIAKAVNDVRAMGVDYFSSAANNNVVVDGHDVGSYEAVGGYRATTCPAAIPAAYTDCHNFNGASGPADPTYGFTTGASGRLTMVLDWAEPQFGVRTDYDLCIMQGAALLGCIGNRNPGVSGSQAADEILQLTGNAGSYSVVVARYGGNDPNTNGTPRFKFVVLQSGNLISGVEYETPTGSDVIGPTIFGHNGTSGAVSTAASDVRVSPSIVTNYSSHGPVTLLYGPVVGTSPAAALPKPQVLAKPDLTASDCTSNTFFGSFDSGTGHYRFCGTSAAAPHAAAVAALLLQQNPGLTPDQVNAALASTATSLGLPAWIQGAGLVDAAAAGAAVVPKPQTIAFAQPAAGAVGGSRALSATASSGLPVTFAVSSATSPSGACTVSGVDGTTVTYRKVGSCVIRADQSGDAIHLPASQLVRSIRVNAAPRVATGSLPPGAVGKKYAARLVASGGTAPSRWRVVAGKLPAGLALSTSGAISGTPTKAGAFAVTFAVTDASTPKATASKRLTIRIAPLAVRTTSLPVARVGKKYAVRLKAYGGKKPLRWKKSAGKLPRGLKLTRSGSFSGKPTKAGSYRITVTVTDAAHKAATRKLVIVVKAR